MSPATLWRRQRRQLRGEVISLDNFAAPSQAQSVPFDVASTLTHSSQATNPQKASARNPSKDKLNEVQTM
eukprot:4309105-Amphidinium_carterae.1